MMRAWMVSLLLALIPAAAPAATTTTKVSVGESHKLIFTHPSTWKSEISGPAIGPTLRLTPSDSGDFVVLMTAIPPTESSPRSQKDLEALVRQTGQPLLPGSMQKELALEPISGKEASGFLFHLTDKNPERGPGDFREARMGAILLNSYVLSVTILTHSDDKTTVPEVLVMLRSAHYQP